VKSSGLQKDGNFRLVPHRPKRRAVMLVLLLVAVSAVAGVGYWFGESRATLDREYLDALERSDRVSEERMDLLRRQLVDAELARSVDQQAAESLRETIRTLRNEIAELREEAALYRNMLDPDDVAQGLRIAAFQLTGSRAPGAYQYHVLLTRSDVEQDRVQGVVELEVKGFAVSAGRRGKARTLELDELAQLPAYPVPVDFRYFQGVAGVMSLPADFEPVEVLIRLVPAGRGARAVLRDFDWQPEAG
jgi:hypothetical protein